MGGFSPDDRCFICITAVQRIDVHVTFTDRAQKTGIHKKGAAAPTIGSTITRTCDPHNFLIAGVFQVSGMIARLIETLDASRHVNLSSLLPPEYMVTAAHPR
jgi:hypothetical protein